MADQSAQAATNERIVRLLEEVKARLDDSKERQERIARDLTRLLARK
jgi:flagellar motility protein MotE (MotC chaperone)